MLKLYNTMTRNKKTFIPRQKKEVKIFTCGPSIYQRPHLGNWRTFLYEDILVRYLEYLGYDVQRVLNFTDIEDKAVEEAEKEGVEVKELTEKIANTFYKETELLHIKSPTYNPRSSTTVDQAVYLIKALLKKEIAYWHEGDVFYDPLKFKGFGRLYRLDMSLWPTKKRHFKKDTYSGMRWNLGDFILWHGCEEGEKVCWDEELGRGRPSWNVQDPAMATKYLGYKIDIHCGGIDNLYRHHDYNLAVVEGVSGETFANYWLHGEHLLLNGKKMSKSKGNVVYMEDFLTIGYSSEHIRFYLIYGHYRKKMNLTNERFQEAAKRLKSLREMIKELIEPKGIRKSRSEVKDLITQLTQDFEEHMNDDLNVKGAFDSIFENLSSHLNIKLEGGLGDGDCKHIYQKLRNIDEILQVIFT
ncbi:MAG: class I tRNA ligase family protein [Thermoplasmata archaeon]|nr:MAG: class I tRNA ligase family protein [Thermoplasmata archaeon]